MHSSSAPKTDFRISWIAIVVERALNIKDESVWKTFVKEESGRNERQLQQLCDIWDKGPKGVEGMVLSNPADEACPLLPYVSFWTNTEEVEIEEEIIRSTTYVADEVTSEISDDDEPNAPLPTLPEALTEEGSRTPALSTRASSHALSKGPGSETALSSVSVASPGDEGRESPPSTVDEEIQKITMKRLVLRTFLRMEGPKRAGSAALPTTRHQDGKRLYLIRTTRGRIPIPDSLESAFRQMLAHFQLDFAGPPDAISFINILRRLYFPLMKARYSTEYLQFRNGAPLDVQQVLNLPHNRILAMQELLWSTEVYSDYLNGLDWKPLQPLFEMPQEMKELLLEEFPLEDGKRESFIGELESVCLSWTKFLEHTFTELQKKLQKCSLPMEEVAFWSEACRWIGDIAEDMRRQEVVAALQMLDREGCTATGNFRFHREELELFLKEAQEVKRYMGILKPSFLVFENSSSLVEIRKAIPGVVSTLRTLWSVSKYFSSSERLAPLMNRIANQLAERVVAMVDVAELLSSNRLQRMANQKKTLEAKLVLEEWKKSYLDVRATSDVTGVVAPWEFDRKRLFERTDYLAGVCHNMHEAYAVLEQFENTNIMEMDAAFYETEQLQTLHRKYRELPQRVFSLTYDPFEIQNGATWKCTMDHFRREVAVIDSDYVRLLDDGFGHLRSTQAALRLIMALQSTDCRPAVKSHARSKVKLASESLIDEIDGIRGKFSRHADDRQVVRNLPPVASSIFRARRLLQQVQPTVRAFQEMQPGEEHTQLLSKIKEKYAELEAAIGLFVESKFQTWATNSQTRISQLLRQPLVLKRDEKAAEGADFVFEANFPIELLTIITEAGYLEYFGFVVPLKIRYAALQKSKYIDRLFLLKSILQKWSEHSWQTDAEQNLKYQTILRQMERACKLSWMSPNVDDYLEMCSWLTDSNICWYFPLACSMCDISTAQDHLSVTKKYTICYNCGCLENIK